MRHSEFHSNVLHEYFTNFNSDLKRDIWQQYNQFPEV